MSALLKLFPSMAGIEETTNLLIMNLALKLVAEVLWSSE